MSDASYLAIIIQMGHLSVTAVFHLVVAISELTIPQHSITDPQARAMTLILSARNLTRIIALG
jgi:hypothetical protein